MKARCSSAVRRLRVRPGEGNRAGATHPPFGRGVAGAFSVRGVTMQTTAAQLLEAGYVGSTDALVQIRELIGDPHSGAGGRAYSFALAGGLTFEVLPERGLDIGAAWFAGRPVGWRSPLGSPGPAPTATGWLGRFGGGLLVTCGLDNIGAPRDGYGQHGSHHDTRAHDVRIERLAGPEGIGVRIAGVVDSIEMFGRRVRVYREITAFTDDPSVQIRDTVVNEGAWPAPVALLYHVNFGAPLVLPGTRIGVDAAEHHSVDDRIDPSWQEFPEAVDEIGESVWQHRGLRTVDGVATASVASPSGLVAEVSWSADELPLLVEWMFPSRQSWALGIEPASAPIFGPERDAEGAGMRVLAPGESINTSLTVRLSELRA